MSSSQSARPFRRRVFYIPGFDPYPARRYRELYRKEGREQAQLSGYTLEMRARIGTEGYAWNVVTQTQGTRAHTRYDILVWNDLVRDGMAMSIPGTYARLVQVAWLYVSSGALRRLMMLRKGPVIAALYPIVVLVLQLLIALVAAWSVSRAVSAVTFPGAGLIVGLPLLVFLMRWFKARDRWLFAYYLMQDYAFTAQRSGANPPELDSRIEDFKQRILAALGTDVDEVLVVGHSSGVHLAINILADLSRDQLIPLRGPKLAFLSLGQVVPMVSFLPRAYKLRADLHHLSQQDHLFWLDVSAPGDGCSFALCDPVSVSGVAPDNKKWPLVISAAFSQTLSPQKWKALRRRYFRLHFQYLCAFDQPADYDYFQITAGPMTLQQRFTGRKPSASRIDVPASPHTAMHI